MDTKDLTKRFGIMRDTAHADLKFAVYDAEVQDYIARFVDKDDATLFIKTKVRGLYNAQMDEIMKKMLSTNDEYLRFKELYKFLPSFIPDYYP